MKKTKLMVTGLMLSSMLVGGMTQSYAATSDGRIVFTQNQGGGNPSDPTDPGKENPNTPDVTGESGPLILKVVPEFHFGSQEVSASAKTYKDTEATTNYIEVRDNRDAGTNGWSVAAKRTEFEDTNSYQLTGSILSIPKGKVRNSLMTTEQGNLGGTATIVDEGAIFAYAADIPVSDTNTITVLETIMNNDNVGKENTTSNLAETTDRAELMIPQNTAREGSFTSTITWIVELKV